MFLQACYKMLQLCAALGYVRAGGGGQWQRAVGVPVLQLVAITGVVAAGAGVAVAAAGAGMATPLTVMRRLAV